MAREYLIACDDAEVTNDWTAILVTGDSIVDQRAAARRSGPRGLYTNAAMGKNALARKTPWTSVGIALEGYICIGFSAKMATLGQVNSPPASGTTAAPSAPAALWTASPPAYGSISNFRFIAPA